MMRNTKQLMKNIVLSLTNNDTKLRQDNLFFDPIPLFSVLGSTMSDYDIDRCLKDVIGDGYGDPVDLDPTDDQQTSRLESTILDFFDDLEIKEFFTIDYAGWPYGLHCSLCLASFANLDFVVLYNPYETPSFMTFGCGNETLKWIIGEGDILLPRFRFEDAEPIQIRMHKHLPWTMSQALACVQNLTGCLLSKDHLLGTERLLSEEDEQACQ